MKTTRLSTLIQQLVKHQPGSNPAEELRYRIEHCLMETMKAGGHAAVDTAVGMIRINRLPLPPAQQTGTLRSWRARIVGERMLELSVNDGGGLFLSASVGYQVAKCAHCSPGGSCSPRSVRLPFMRDIKISAGSLIGLIVVVARTRDHALPPTSASFFWWASWKPM